jgi:hypothetical protein
MAKWADYLISAVKYEETNTTRHISQVRVHVDNGETVETGSVWSRKEVMNKLDNGLTFMTIITNAKGDWAKGASVFKIEEFGDYYIKTKPDKTKKDNLESLPEIE